MKKELPSVYELVGQRIFCAVMVVIMQCSLAVLGTKECKEFYINAFAKLKQVFTLTICKMLTK